MWLLLVGAGYNAIARLEGGLRYQAFVFPGVVVMAALFGGMLTAISTVYDREFGMLRLMLASPAGRRGGAAGAGARGERWSGCCRAASCSPARRWLCTDHRQRWPPRAALAVGRRRRAPRSGSWWRRGSARSRTSPG